VDNHLQIGSRLCWDSLQFQAYKLSHNGFPKDLFAHTNRICFDIALQPLSTLF